MNQKTIFVCIEGRIPSKKNSKRICNKRLLSSSRYLEWEDEQVYRIKNQAPDKPIEKAKIEILFYMPDNRRADLTNKAESIMDLLVKTQFIRDDCWQVVSSVLLKFVEIDKKNPRAEVFIRCQDIHLKCPQ